MGSGVALFESVTGGEPFGGKFRASEVGARVGAVLAADTPMDVEYSVLAFVVVRNAQYSFPDFRESALYPRLAAACQKNLTAQWFISAH
jgi:hypothetical protein